MDWEFERGRICISKLEKELISLKEELNHLKSREIEENLEKIKTLTDESKVLNERLLEKDGEIERLLENMKSFEEDRENL